MDLFGKKATAAKLLQLEQKVTEYATVIEENKISELVVLQEKAISQRIETVMRNFHTQIYAKYNTGVAKNAYQTVSNFYSVVSTIANEAAAIPFRPEMKKSGVEVSDNDKIWAFIDLLPLDKKIACYTFFLTQGEIFIYKEKLEFGINAGIQNMVPLNPLNVSVFITEGFPVEILGYRYWDSLHGITVDILPEDMVFVKNFNPSEDLNLQVRGLAPADVLMQRQAWKQVLHKYRMAGYRVLFMIIHPALVLKWLGRDETPLVVTFATLQIKMLHISQLVKWAILK